MSKRLLKENVALKKIELSLKLQGKSFKSSFLTCGHCKFYWSNTPTGYPKWSRIVHDPITGLMVDNACPKPEKYSWYCFKYKNYPYHSLLRFNIIRTNCEGRVIPIKSHWVPPLGNTNGTWANGSWSTEPAIDEKDTLVFVEAGKKYRCGVCRRFEACPR